MCDGFQWVVCLCWDDGGELQFEDVKYKVEMKATADAAHAGAMGSLLHCRLSCVSLKKTVTKVRHSPPEKFILNGITASVAPGQMLALMGPSGSGKTTLLNALAGRLHKNLSGTISFNGLSFSSSLKRR
jgi:ABC-type multidrug transport system fused ATPase/permease subunit